MIRNLILKVIDPFHIIFSKFLNLQTYRYAVCGAANTSFDIFLYFIFYNFILDKQVFHIGSLAIGPHIAAFFLAFVITFPIGFFLMRMVVFSESPIGGWNQLVRYFSVVMLNVFLNYSLLKILVEYFDIYPTPSKVISTFLIVTITYLLQKYFTFKQPSQKKQKELLSENGIEETETEEVYFNVKKSIEA
jgi:putative flippase GtrA